MPDITMCQDRKCPRNWACHRFTAKPSEWQSYFYKSPRKGKRCEMFVENSAVGIMNTLLKAVGLKPIKKVR